VRIEKTQAGRFKIGMVKRGLSRPVGPSQRYEHRPLIENPAQFSRNIGLSPQWLRLAPALHCRTDLAGSDFRFTNLPIVRCPFASILTSNPGKPGAGS